MKNNQETKFIGGIQYILDNGRWVSVYGMDLDPHDPNYLLFTPIKRYLFKVVKYNSARPELLIINAIIAANNNTTPLAASSLKNHLKGLDI